LLTSELSGEAAFASTSRQLRPIRLIKRSERSSATQTLIRKSGAHRERARRHRGLAARGEQRRRREVPPEVEYDEPPRGRVVYDTIANRFHLYADHCILADKALVRNIIVRLGVPRGRLDVGPDKHYRCAECHRGSEA